MAKIAQYTSEADIRPTEVGIEATAAAARRGGAFFNQVASDLKQLGSETAHAGEDTARMAGNVVRSVGHQAVEYVEHREKQAGALADAQLTDRLTNEWNERVKNADPNDPTVAAKFRQEVLEPNLQKFGESFLSEGGQKFAEARVERLRDHMFQKTTADMATLAGAAVTTNIRTIANERSNTAVSDPSSVPHLLSTIDADVASIVDSSPNLKGAAATKARIELTEKMREQIVKSGAIGAIQKAGDPDAVAAKWIAKYPDYINGAEALQLARAARTQKNSDRIDQERAIVQQDRIRKETSEARRDAYITNLYSDDQNKVSAITAKGIVNDPMLTVQDKEHLVGVLKRELKPETDSKISAQTSVQIMRMLRDPNADPQKIDDAIFEARTKDPGAPGSLTKSDMQDLQKQLEDRKTPQGLALTQDRAEFFKRYAPAIDPSMGDVRSLQFGHHTALGQQKMYEAEKAARRAEADAKAKGQDPHSVYDPSSPNFFGKPENIMRFRASLQDSQRYQERIEKAEKESAFKPPAGWVYSPSRNQYKDPTTNKIYGADGKEAK